MTSLLKRRNKEVQGAKPFPFGESRRKNRNENNTKRFYLDRIAGRNRDHRHSGVHVAAGAGQSQSHGPTGCLLEQLEAMGVGGHDVLGRKPANVSIPEISGDLNRGPGQPVMACNQRLS